MAEPVVPEFVGCQQSAVVHATQVKRDALPLAPIAADDMGPTPAIGQVAGTAFDRLDASAIGADTDFRRIDNNFGARS